MNCNRTRSNGILPCLPAVDELQLWNATSKAKPVSYLSEFIKKKWSSLQVLFSSCFFHIYSQAANLLSFPNYMWKDKRVYCVIRRIPTFSIIHFAFFFCYLFSCEKGSNKRDYTLKPEHFNRSVLYWQMVTHIADKIQCSASQVTSCSFYSNCSRIFPDSIKHLYTLWLRLKNIEVVLTAWNALDVITQNSVFSSHWMYNGTKTWQIHQSCILTNVPNPSSGT